MKDVLSSIKPSHFSQAVSDTFLRYLRQDLRLMGIDLQNPTEIVAIPELGRSRPDLHDLRYNKANNSLNLPRSQVSKKSITKRKAKYGYTGMSDERIREMADEGLKVKRNRK